MPYSWNHSDTVYPPFDRFVVPRFERESCAQGDYDNAEPLYRMGVRIADDVYAGRGDDGSTIEWVLTARVSWSSMLVARVSALTPCLERTNLAQCEVSLIVCTALDHIHVVRAAAVAT